MLHPQSGQAIFVGPHSSGMMDSAGFVAAMFEVIVLPVSAVEKLQDKPIIQYRQYLMCFSAALPCVKGRLWSRWKIVFFFFLPFKRWNWLSGVTLHILLWYFWYYCSTFWGEKKISYFFFFLLAFFSVSSRSVGVHLVLKTFSTEWAEGTLDCSATDCGTESGSGVHMCTFCPLCTFYHICKLATL